MSLSKNEKSIISYLKCARLDNPETNYVISNADHVISEPCSQL